MGGGGAVTAPHAPPQSQRRDDRRQLALITSSPCPPSRSRPPKITEIASSSRDEGSVGGGGAVRAPYAPPKSRRRDDRPRLAPITWSQCPPSRQRPPEITEIASSSRDEGSVGGGGAADGAIRPAKSRQRDDRPRLAPITWSQCPPSRQRPPEITEIASSSRDEGAVGGGGAVRAPKGVSRRLIMTLDLLV